MIPKLPSFVRKLSSFTALRKAGSGPIAPTFTPTSRHALVIGNSNYPRDPLPRAANDADDIATELMRIGFNTVFLLKDATREDITQASSKLGLLRENGDLAFIYYAGRAFEWAQETYLQTVEHSQQDVVLLSHLMSVWTGTPFGPYSANATVAVFDGDCGSPIIPSVTTEFGARHQIHIECTADPGKSAYGGVRNGFFTQCLLRHISKDLTLEQLFQCVRFDLSKQTLQDQSSWSVSNVYQDIKLVQPNNTSPVINNI